MNVLWIGRCLFLRGSIWTVRTKTLISVLGSVTVPGKRSKTFLLFLKCTSCWQQTKKNGINCYQLLRVFYLGSACLFVFSLLFLIFYKSKQASTLINFITSANLESKQKDSTHSGNNIQTKHFPERAYVSYWFFSLTSKGTAFLLAF